MGAFFYTFCRKRNFGPLQFSGLHMIYLTTPPSPPSPSASPHPSPSPTPSATPSPSSLPYPIHPLSPLLVSRNPSIPQSGPTSSSLSPDPPLPHAPHPPLHSH